MTVITSASLERKPAIGSVMVESGRPETRRVKRTYITSVFVWRPHCTILLLIMSAIGVLTFVGTVLMTTIFIRDLHLQELLTPRYKGYCSVPLEINDVPQGEVVIPGSPYKMTLRWRAEPNDVDMSVFQTDNSPTEVEALNNLFERFEIDDQVEKISVLNGGHSVDFVHDFGSNTSGIVDNKRCFLMDLDTDIVMQPHHIVQKINHGLAFDVMKVVSQMRAALPPAPGAASARALNAFFAETCNDRPTYKLDPGLGDPIRKRDTNAPSHDYIHFSGIHVQQIAIENMDEVKAYEAEKKKKKRSF